MLGGQYPLRHQPTPNTTDATKSFSIHYEPKGGEVNTLPFHKPFYQHYG